MEAARAELQGEVLPALAGEVIRYRVWFPVRYPVWTTVAGSFVVLCTSATWFFMGAVLWSVLVGLGLTLTLALLIFPTEVSLDGAALHLRQLWHPRTWDLQDFNRLVIGQRPLHRVVLHARSGRDPRARITQVVVPLPHEPEAAEAVIAHIRKRVTACHEDLDRPVEAAGVEEHL
jgi:hypothetical protein